VLVRNLTHDGWAVIIICFFMSIISWIIMFNKVRLLNAINKGNTVFMDQWKRLSRDLTSLDGCDIQSIKTMGGRVTPEQQKSISKSSVYRLYHIGSDELSHRLKAEGGDDAGISARSMEAIKATMDSGLVREGQRLNKFVVLLTICISGGPFLGLLGTVIGVMITFAAIAAEGAVDVNNIAPGIAGALLATVAGLAVAIPALFGYNYILSKIKECQADMSVFIDEFVTRMAENYPDAKGAH
jgi:biopolymer transport protein ExbB